jgi:hypothetical protein
MRIESKLGYQALDMEELSEICCFVMILLKFCFKKAASIVIVAESSSPFNIIN